MRSVHNKAGVGARGINHGVCCARNLRDADQDQAVLKSRKKKEVKVMCKKNLNK